MEKTPDKENMTLRQCKEGDRVKILSVSGKGPFKKRLLEMGFVPGTTVFVKKYAPLRDPIEFVLKNYHVSLRRSEAKLILVEKAE